MLLLASRKVEAYLLFMAGLAFSNVARASRFRQGGMRNIPGMRVDQGDDGILRADEAIE
jgi:hypothetical protein